MIHPRMLVIGIMLISMLTLAACGGDDTTGAASAPTDAMTGAATYGQLQPLTAGRDILAPDGRYSLRIPADWIEYDDPIAELGFRATDLSTPKTLNVVREDLNGVNHVQAYAESARDRISSVYKNVITLSRSPVKVGDREAYRWVYTATAGSKERLFYQMFIIDGDQGFVLTGMAPADASPTDTQALFDSIAGTLSFARG